MNIRSFTRNNFWLSWLIFVIVVLLVHSLTLTISPPIWQDEVQIIDYGRVFLDPITDYSVTWDIASKRPVFSLFYLGEVAQELVFRLTNFSLYGPRLLSILGAIIAATMSIGWLSCRQVPSTIAWISGVILLLDPMFVQSYRGDRIDCWVFALCFASCWLLRLASKKLEQNNYPHYLIFLAGSLCSIAIFTWPSYLIIFPLVVVEFFSLLNTAIKQKANIITIVCYSAIFILGSISTLLLLITPLVINNQLNTAINDFLSFSKTRASSFRLDSLIMLLKSFRISPFIFLGFVISLIYSRKLGIILVSFFALSLVLSSGVYIYRAIYLVPYITVLISETYNSNSFLKLRFLNFKVANTLLTLLLAWSISLTLIMRPIIGLGNQQGRNPLLPVNIGISHIGQGSYKVWDSTWQFYPASRLLGWKVFTSINLQGKRNKLQSLFSDIDYLIFSSSNNQENLAKLFGFNHKEYVEPAIVSNNNPFTKLLNLFTKQLKSKLQYGPYIIYSKKQ